MDPSKDSSRPKTMMETNLDEPQAAGSGSTASAMEQLRAERTRVEEYTKEQYARLSKLRELIRAEKTATEQDRQKETPVKADPRLKEEVEQLQQQLKVQHQALQKIATERDAAVAELQSLNDQAPDVDKLLAERDAALEQLQQQREKEPVADAGPGLAALQAELEALHQQLRGEQEQIQRLGRERDEARSALKNSAPQLKQLDKLKAERDAALAQIKLLELEPGEWAQQEEELVAERRQLRKERQQLTEEAKELYQREQSMREQLSALKQTQKIPVLDKGRQKLAQQLDQERKQLEEKGRELNECIGNILALLASQENKKPDIPGQ